MWAWVNQLVLMAGLHPPWQMGATNLVHPGQEHHPEGHLYIWELEDPFMYGTHLSGPAHRGHAFTGKGEVSFSLVECGCSFPSLGFLGE